MKWSGMEVRYQPATHTRLPLDSGDPGEATEAADQHKGGR